jgi:multicomponent Na+:H+ antiporter subunit G
MTAHTIALVLVGLGCVVIALSVVGAVVVVDDVFVKLHFLTPVTSLGAPLVAVGLCVESGQPWVIAELLVIALLLALSGPVLESATARVAAEHRGLVDMEQPE